jgi:DNA-binding winged helix-turn-helix (wHTH) protein/TolB-like protein/Flp pilus assembly protein TadD
MSTIPRPQRYAFGDFVLEPSQQRVRHVDGTLLNLTPRLFSALLLFVERAGELLDKDTLILALWPGLVVEENNLSQVISGLRRALGDDTQSSRYIETVPRRGFRFIAEVTTPSEGAQAQALEAVLPETSQTQTLVAATPDDQLAEVPPPLVIGPSPRSGSRRRWLGSVVAGTTVVAAAGVWWAMKRQATSPRPITLAVLPFKPLSAEGRDELLEFGMADSLIARLSTVPGLVVRSVASVRQLLKTNPDPIQAARELDVDWIVDGSLQRRDQQVRVTARLLSAADGTAAWSGSFDEKFTGVFELQDTISQRIAAVLVPLVDAAAPTSAQGRAPGSVHANLTGAGGTRNSDAYQLYLAARQFAQGVSAAGLRKSIELYNKALDFDPAYALAYAGLVESYRRMIFGADVSPVEAFEPAKIAAQRGMALAPELAEAHAGLGWIRFWYDFDWPEAERIFRSALALNPNVVEAHFGLASLLLALDRPDEGLSHMRSARELDPLSPILNALEAGYLVTSGRRDEAKIRLQRVLDIAPKFWVAQLTLARLQAADHQTDQAIESLRRADALADGSTQAAAPLGAQLARAGHRDEALGVLDRVSALQKIRYVPPTSIAAIQSALGLVEPALDTLERAYSVRDPRLVYMKDDDRWLELRSQPRFAALLKRMKLDTYGAGSSAL